MRPGTISSLFYLIERSKINSDLCPKTYKLTRLNNNNNNKPPSSKEDHKRLLMLFARETKLLRFSVENIIETCVTTINGVGKQHLLVITMKASQSFEWTTTTTTTYHQ